MAGRKSANMVDSSKKIAISPEQLVEKIRTRAYDIALSRGSNPGSPLDDWLKAEELIKQELGIKA